MKRRKPLAFGETPFHKMTKKQLITVACQMYAALSRTRSQLAISKETDALINPHNTPYWGRSGMGGLALEMAVQALEAALFGYARENVYRAFFRYANDLLFDSTTYEIGSGWMVCTACKTMLGSRHNRRGMACREVFNSQCTGVLRPLTWDDLKPEDVS